jgi:hypothetical protein
MIRSTSGDSSARRRAGVVVALAAVIAAGLGGVAHSHSEGDRSHTSQAGAGQSLGWNNTISEVTPGTFDS